MAVKYRQTHVQTSSSYTAWLLYFYSLPYFLSILSKLINGEVIHLILVASVFVTLMLSAVWMKTGLKNKENYLIKKYSNNTPFPMMFLASLLVGSATLVAAWLIVGYNLFAGIGFGLTATIGCWLWYGLDPVKSKHINFNDINDSEKALEILQNSEALVISIENSNKKINNNEMSNKLTKITSVARDVLGVLYQNPKKITKARRFLNTYLKGAESVVLRYAETHKEKSAQKLEGNFREVLDNIEQVFTEQHEKLLSSDVFDLDVDIEVLNTLLKKQGIN
ncbi:MAG: 5-bromo-4-chloroindolyl phosphate hydrolysis family protein [Proteobacteria bacterium]|nr:5-bromo-4-chloroindolyl phosphate hydrolysis family protein [Pseudomonadota bacterium]